MWLSMHTLHTRTISWLRNISLNIKHITHKYGKALTYKETHYTDIYNINLHLAEHERFLHLHGLGADER